MAKRRTKAEKAFHDALNAAVMAKALAPEVFQDVQGILDDAGLHERMMERLRGQVESADAAKLEAETALAEHDISVSILGDREVRLEQREAALIPDEHRLEVREAKLAAKEDAVNWMRGFATDIVRAPVFRRTVDTTVPVAVPGIPASNDPYHSGSIPYVEKVDTKTETEESQK